VGTTLPAVMTNLAAALRLRTVFIGPPKVGVHTVMLDAWTDSEAVVFTGATGPRSFATMADPGTDQAATLQGIVFAELAGADDAKATAAQVRAGVILDDLVAYCTANPTIGGALADVPGPPLLTQETWSTWMAEQDGGSVARVRVEWALTWSAAT
jgi:hypothetical protein